MDHVPFFSLGPSTALPTSNSDSGGLSQKTSNSSPSPWSLIYAAEWDSPPSSQCEGVIYHYYQLQSTALCLAWTQLQLQRVCFATEGALRLAVALLEVQVLWPKQLFSPSINTLFLLLGKSCFRELWSVYWPHQSQHLLVLKFQAASFKG